MECPPSSAGAWPATFADPGPHAATRADHLRPGGVHAPLLERSQRHGGDYTNYVTNLIVLDGQGTAHRGLAAQRDDAPLVRRARRDKYDQSTDPPQGTTPSALLWDVVLSGQAERYRLRYALGLYNAANYRYAVPVSREFQQESIVQRGRTALLSAQVTF